MNFEVITRPVPDPEAWVMQRRLHRVLVVTLSAWNVAVSDRLIIHAVPTVVKGHAQRAGARSKSRRQSLRVAW